MGDEENVDEILNQFEEGVWDSANEGYIPMAKVREAKGEEIGFMEDRKIWSIKSIKECWGKTGKAPVSVRWAIVNKGTPDEMVIRCRLVARDFKGGDKDRDDLFAETPPLEAKRMLLSRAATRLPIGIEKKKEKRKIMFIDATEM